jgi:hypothetical protein
VAVGRLGGGEQLPYPVGLGECLPDRLRSLDEEPPAVVAVAAAA